MKEYEIIQDRCEALGIKVEQMMTAVTRSVMKSWDLSTRLHMITSMKTGS